MRRGWRLKRGDRKVSASSCSGTFFFRTHGTEERLSIITILIIIILVLLVIYVARRAL
jgi:hypothetical protein